jgi:hypothetical protein
MAALMMTGLLYLLLGSRMLLGVWNSAIGFTSVLLLNSSLCNLTTFFYEFDVPTSVLLCTC